MDSQWSDYPYYQGSIQHDDASNGYGQTNVKEYPHHHPPTTQWNHSNRHSRMSQQHNNYDQPFMNRYPDQPPPTNPTRQSQPVKAKATVSRDVKKKKDPSAVSPLVKHFLFGINVLFFFVGIALMSMCIYVLLESDEDENQVNCFLDFVFNPVCLALLLGCLVWVPSFMGCYGALRENTCVIKLYVAFAILLILIELVVGAFVVTFTLEPSALSSIGVYPGEFLEENLVKYGDRVHKADGCGRDSDSYFDLIQDKFSCCGATNDDEGYLDWEKNQYYNCNSTTPTACSVPISCCKADTTTSDCGVNLLDPGTTDLSSIYTRGCEKGMREVLKDNIILISAGILGGIVLQIFFMRCATTLSAQVSEQRSKW